MNIPIRYITINVCKVVVAVSVISEQMFQVLTQISSGKRIHTFVCTTAQRANGWYKIFV